jgi:hypothetical protein
MAVGLSLLGVLALPVQAQATAGVHCAVRIRSRAAADYDHSTEVLLHGLVIGREQGMLLLRIAAGIVRVEVGSWEDAVVKKAPAEVVVLAAKRQEEGRQRLVAREIRFPGGCVTLRDANGAPLQP